MLVTHLLPAADRREPRADAFGDDAHVHALRFDPGRMESRVRTLERASVPAEQVEFPGCVEADVMDRLGGVHAGNRRDRQRTVRALPAPVDAGPRLDHGRPATGHPATPGPPLLDRPPPPGAGRA